MNSRLYLLMRISALLSMVLCAFPMSGSAQSREERKEQELNELQKKFEWWPTDAKPGPVKDEKKGGYWWWPASPGNVTPWGNRGYIYVHKIIFDYKADELPPAQPQELRPSLLIKRIHKNLKVYFDYDSSDLRDDAQRILREAVRTLMRNPEADILITGNCDTRGSESYNEQLGANRAQAVKDFMVSNDVPEERIRIVSRGKLDAVAPITDLVGMQRDRNAQFMVAEVEEVMIPAPGEIEESEAVPLEEGKYLIEKEEEVEAEVKVATREYTIQKNDSLWKIAESQMGSGHRWKYLYEFNKEVISDPDRLEAGTVIVIPVEREAPIHDASVVPVLQPKPEVQEEPQGAEQPAGSTRTYTIQKNDSLWKIAQKELGDGNRWKEIYELNKDKIGSPDKLTPGEELVLP